MVNEVLCKLLCHNVCCLIQEQCELGIEPVFWPDEEEEKPAATPSASLVAHAQLALAAANVKHVQASLWD
jgi:hypothetical protein